MHKILLALSGVLLVFSYASAETYEALKLKPGYKWVYVTTTEKLPTEWSQKRFESTVLRSTSTNYVLSTKEVDSKLPPVEALYGLDLSKSRNFEGQDFIVEQPLKFPLEVGSTWSISYSQKKPNDKFSIMHTTLDYVVVGWEDVEVPAGRFRALKIEASGKWKGDLAPSSSIKTTNQSNQGGAIVVVQTHRDAFKTIAGNLLRVYWYVPSANTIVKSIEESYNTGDTLSQRITRELVSYSTSP